MLEAELRNIIKSITENSNQLAFQKLFEHFFPRLNAFSYSIIKNHQRSQEIVQDVFLKVWNNKQPLVFSAAAAYPPTAPVLPAIEAYKVLWPIDVGTLNNDPALGGAAQNPGY
jgi:hypothetical protein